MWWNLVLIGVIFLVPASINIVKGKKSENWLRTEGKVISSEVESSFQEVEGYVIENFIPRIQYGYSVGGEKYRSSNLRLIDGSMSKEKARLMVESYPPGHLITIYYNPDKSSDAVLVTGTPKYIYVLAVIGAVLIFAGLLVLFL